MAVSLPLREELETGDPTRRNDEPLLRARDLVREVGGRRIVDIPLLEVGQGEVVALLGPNGAGKSTLLRLLLLLERPDSGRIFLAGRRVHPGDAGARRAIAGMLQQPSLFTGSVLANVVYGLRARGIARPEALRRAHAVLDELEIDPLADADVRRLSGGESQRVALARALVVEPTLLGLDEPSAGLDVVVRRAFREALERSVRVHAAGCILVTHDPAEAFLLADRILVMEEGRVVQQGTADQLVMEPRTPFVATFTGAELLLDGIVGDIADGTLHVRLENGVVLTATHGGARVSVGQRAHVAYRPEDVMLAPANAAEATSARNSLRLEVASLSPVGGLVRVRLAGKPALVAHVTRAAADALGLAPGLPVRALLKATALRAFPAPPRQRPEPLS